MSDCSYVNLDIPVEFADQIVGKLKERIEEEMYLRDTTKYMLEFIGEEVDCGGENIFHALKEKKIPFYASWGRGDEYEAGKMIHLDGLSVTIFTDSSGYVILRATKSEDGMSVAVMQEEIDDANNYLKLEKEFTDKYLKEQA